jgi:hypothetical protein
MSYFLLPFGFYNIIECHFHSIETTTNWNSISFNLKFHFIVAVVCLHCTLLNEFHRGNNVSRRGENIFKIIKPGFNRDTIRVSPGILVDLASVLNKKITSVGVSNNWKWTAYLPAVSSGVVLSYSSYLVNARVHNKILEWMTYRD